MLCPDYKRMLFTYVCERIYITLCGAYAQNTPLNFRHLLHVHTRIREEANNHRTPDVFTHMQSHPERAFKASHDN